MVSNTDQCVYAHPEKPPCLSLTNSHVPRHLHDHNHHQQYHHHLDPRPATKPKHANPTNNHDVPSSSERAASEGERKQKSAKNQGLYISRNCELCGTRSGPAAQDSRLIARYSHIRSLALLSLACCCSRCSACWALLLCPSSIATLVLLCARASNRPLAIETRCAVIWL